ncbi:MAG TPA: hypothetical protein DHV00_12810, partial [Alteromonas macleodii]|nr:hypothetical protein [Alteromonas macleodii]
PFGFTDEAEYEEFVRTTFEQAYSNTLQFDFFNIPAEKRSFVRAIDDPVISRDHFKAPTEIESLEEFSAKKFFDVAEPKNFTIIN